MKKSIISIAIAATMCFTATACTGGKAGSTAVPHPSTTLASDTSAALIAPGKYRPDTALTFAASGSYDKARSFIVISKRELRLKVYAPTAKGDTVLVARYPVCLSRALGQKHRRGDMRTPESRPGAPFSIVQIQDASRWKHDFGDGRGAFLSYGHWFLRLRTPGHSGIGIHGSTGNENKMPGRDSEGCIRLRDCDIEHLHDHYARLGMPVIIKAEGEGTLPFERRLANAATHGSKIAYKH